MRQTIPVESLVQTIGPQVEDMAHAIETCVHCGFCLPACPTYAVLGQEQDSPRGRIVLMKGVLEGELPLNDVLPHIDRCLGCLGCVPVCPSGVPYGDLITPFRAYAESQRQRPLMEQARRRLVRETLPHPNRFRAAAAAGQAGKALGGLLPAELQGMVAMLPERLPPPGKPLPHIYPALGKRRARVALLAGCVQQVLAPNINWATLRVLAHNGVEVLVPKQQGCCGALLAHMGDPQAACDLARHNLGIFPDDVDAILTNAAGCGSGMKEYPLWFKGQPEHAQAQAFAGRVHDVSVFLAALGLVEPQPLPRPLTVAYHDACHLAHAQGITAQPRQLLRAIPNLTLVNIPEGDLCCGSAGTYNLEQPDIAETLGQRKARHIIGTGAQALVSGNIGCLNQLHNHLTRLGHPVPIYHTVEVLDMAYRQG